MKVSVLIPYKPSGVQRRKAFDWICARYQQAFPEFELCIGMNNKRPFSRSEARNNAYSKSTGDLLIINDADTFCNVATLKKAIRLFEIENPPWILPYVKYFNLTKAGAASVLSGPPTTDFKSTELDIEITVDARNHPPDGSVAGVLLVPHEGFEMVQGYDENFQGWGYEDDAFAMCMDTMWGAHHRLPGFVAHLWHPPAPDGDFKNPNLDKNQERWKKYRLARGDIREMLIARQST